MKNIFISLIIILLLHYIFNYLKSNLSKPKVKDLVRKPQFKYNEIIEIIKNNEKDEIIHNSFPEESHDMKDELEQYMKDLSENNTSSLPMYESI